MAEEDKQRTTRGAKAANRLTAVAVIMVIFGILVVVAGNLAGWGWTRIIGATLISFGGLSFGAVVALVEPRRERLRAEIMRQRVVIAVIVAIVLVVPVAAVLLAATVGMFRATEGDTLLRVGGACVGLFLLIACIGSTTIAVRATQKTPRNIAVRASGQEEA